MASTASAQNEQNDEATVKASGNALDWLKDMMVDLKDEHVYTVAGHSSHQSHGSHGSHQSHQSYSYNSMPQPGDENFGAYAGLEGRNLSSTPTSTILPSSVAITKKVKRLPGNSQKFRDIVARTQLALTSRGLDVGAVNSVLNIGSALIILIGALYYFGRFPLATMLWSEDFKDQMYECDHAMKAHYIAKKRLELNPSELSAKDLQATELGLVVCHEYDKTRKKLMKWGLSESHLSELGLEAIGEKNYGLSKIVETHELRY